MTGQKKDYTNKLKYGFIPGLVFPFLIFLIIYIVQYKGIGFWDYLQSMWQFQLLFKLLSLCVIPNLLLFLYFFKRKFDLAARGVLMATFIYALLVLITSIV